MLYCMEQRLGLNNQAKIIQISIVEIQQLWGLSQER
jgi:hypothetical protein